ncbi:spermatocyte protein spe-26-like [Clavelina lepadiformis]|uniref:TIR domain-containing protein n=1 Tax=Clavelina lepadiformis TaxID=159417 RepID=A0ABP0EX64_CLALP
MNVWITFFNDAAVPLVTLAVVLITSTIFLRKCLRKGKKMEEFSKKPQKAIQAEEVDGPIRSTDKSHIMISYNWQASHRLAKKVYDRLQEKDYNVWFDQGNLKGALYEKMQEAVDNAFVILMFVSKNYENSANCRREAFYAADIKKPIIPIHEDYEPQGKPKGVRLITAGEIYYKFNNDNFDENFEELCKGINEKMSKKEISPKEKAMRDWRILMLGGQPNARNVVEIFNLNETETATYKSIPENQGMKAACSILLNRCVYFIGGCEINKFVMKSSKGVRVLNLKEKKPDWANAESMNEERCFMGAAVLRGKIYVVGGSNGKKVLSSGESFDPDDEKWTNMPDMKQPRREHQIVACKGNLYALGGRTDSYEDPISTVERLNLFNETNKWEMFDCPGNLPRNLFAAVGVNDEIYVIGGYSTNGKLLKSVKKCKVSEETPAWKEVDSLEKERGECSACVIENKIYVFGGRDSNGKTVDSIERYNTEDEKPRWQKVGNIPQEAMRSRLHAAVVV